MDRKLQIAVLKYLEGREASRSQIIGEVSKSKKCEREVVQEAINILEDNKEICAMKKYEYAGADTFTLADKGYETLSPWYKKKVMIRPVITAIIVGVIITVIALIIEYHFFQ